MSMGKLSERTKREYDVLYKTLTDLQKHNIVTYSQQLEKENKALEAKLEAARDHFLKFPMDLNADPEPYLEAVAWWGDLGDILCIEMEIKEETKKDNKPDEGLSAVDMILTPTVIALMHKYGGAGEEEKKK